MDDAVGTPVRSLRDATAEAKRKALGIDETFWGNEDDEDVLDKLESTNEEAGEDFDLDIAEGSLVAAVDHLVALAPPSDIGVLINLGDFFHTDTMKNQTARSTNALDVDTRWLKIRLHEGHDVTRADQRRETGQRQGDLHALPQQPGPGAGSAGDGSGCHFQSPDR